MCFKVVINIQFDFLLPNDDIVYEFCDCARVLVYL